ncbi:PD-(D/E)XK nuclease family protein [Halalkalibacter sp. AB-rgal2]|uniref:PD-(D/E)XK nuclease family protein n=1 Tax=Halalkalibacter sp. AB-rgal2 TaxID=3242695 RepID=UPI00359E3FAD
MKQIIYGAEIHVVAHKSRLEATYKRQQETNNRAFYLLPSSSWLKQAREKQPGLIVCTFDDLATYILDQKEMSYLSLTEEERTLFFQQFVRDESMFDGEMNMAKARGYADTYGQIKRLGVGVQELEGSLKPLIPLFMKYEQVIINEKKLLDPENRILSAIQSLLNGKGIHLSHVVIDGFFDFSPLQSLFIKALKDTGAKIEVILPNESFEIVEQTVRELEQMGFDNHWQPSKRSKQENKKKVIAATTIEEQWRGVMEEISLSSLPEEQIGILLVDEQDGLQQLQRYADMYHIPLQTPVKRTIETTAIFSFIKRVIEWEQRPLTKWEQLPIVEQVLKLHDVKGLSFAKQKKDFLENGQWLDERYKQLYDMVFEWKRSDEDLFIHYLTNLLDWLKRLPLLSYWQEKLMEKGRLSVQQEIADEFKALELIVSKVEAELTELKEKNVDVKVTFELFVEWFRAIGSSTSIFKIRGSKRGIAIHTWRDIRSFLGKRLYVVGMNEGRFPSPHRLGGYVQERDLAHLPIRYSAPTQEHFQLKQQAYVDQLALLQVETIIFTYVRGVDPEHPHLPSPYLMDLYIDEVWSWQKRMQKAVSLTKQSFVEQVASKIGEGYKVDQIPASLLKVQERQARLAEAKERFTSEYAAKKKKHIVAVTELESYARCSFRFAMERGLNVGELKAKQEQVSPLSIGQVVHDLIEGVYRDCQLVNRPFGSATDIELQQVPVRLREQFEEKWVDVEQQNHELSRLDLMLKKEQWQQRLIQWWQAELKHFWHNHALEEMKIMAFEYPVRLELPISEEESLILVGKVDRVDQKGQSIVIYDYKTGAATIKMDEVQSGLKLQLPLYAYAIREQLALKENKEMIVDGASYISLKEPSKRTNNGIWRSELIGKHSPYQVTSHCKNREDDFGTKSFLDKYQVIERVHLLWKGMSQSYDVAPQECSPFCSYLSICRATPEQREGTR